MAAIQGDWYASAGLPNEAYPQSDVTVRFVYATQPNGERYIVAKVWPSDGGDYESTARLLAAAPELLDACASALGTIQYLLSHSDNGPADNCMEVLAAAIAKAEGRDE